MIGFLFIVNIIHNTSFLRDICVICVQYITHPYEHKKNVKSNYNFDDDAIRRGSNDQHLILYYNNTHCSKINYKL